MDAEAIHRLLLDCGFRDAPWPPRGARRWSLIGAVEDGVEIVVACVADGAAHHLRVSPSSARELLVDVLEQNGVKDVAVRADPDGARLMARGPWLALGFGIGAVALFAWSLLN